MNEMPKLKSGKYGKVSQNVVEDRRLNKTDILLMIALGTYADQRGYCWPSVTTLAESIGVGVRYVRRRLKHLEELGHIQRISRYDDQGRQTSNGYLVKIVSGSSESSVETKSTDVAGGGLTDPRGLVRQAREEGGLGDHPNNPERTNIYFEKFWSSYPSRKPHSNPRNSAESAFREAIKKGDNPEDIILGAKNYAAQVVQASIDPKFVSQARNWLRERRWEDHQQEPTRNPVYSKVGGPL